MFSMKGGTSSGTGGSNLFSGTRTSSGLGSTGASNEGFFSKMVGAATDVAREVIPIWYEKQLRDQQQDQLRNPTYDQRTAGGRFSHVDTTQGTTRQAVLTTSSIVPGVSNGALIVGTLALVGVFVIARSL